MIPNIFHFVFGLRKQIEPFHLMYYLCIKSCIEVNKPDTVHFHFHHEPWGEWWERIRPEIQIQRIQPDKFVAEYEYKDTSINPYRYAHFADFSRLQILLEAGGIYADIDTLFLKPIPRDWYSRPFILGEERPPTGATESLCNAWIGASQGSEFCRLWLDGMREAFDGSWSNHSTLLPSRLARKNPDLVAIEPETSFYALDHSPKGIDDIFLRYSDLRDESYSVHLWNHLWFARNRRDFSCFHAGLLTVDYVRYANTTYAHYARKHLPSDAVGNRLAYRAQQLDLTLLRSGRSLRTWLHSL